MGLPGCCGVSNTGAARRVGSAGAMTIPDIGTTRCLLTTGAARLVTVQVGRHGRAVSEVAADLGCGWYAVVDDVVAIGEQLINRPDRIGPSSYCDRAA